MWDHLRAALIVLHLLAVTLAAFPVPRGVSRADLDQPDLAPIFAAAAALTGGTATDARAATFSSIEATLSARRALLAPFSPYYRLCGTGQGWAMFGILNHTPASLEIDIDRGAGWRPLYHASDRAADWRAGLWRQERMRAFVNNFSWRRSRSRYRQLADWVAIEAASDEPEARAIRVRMRPRPMPEPAALRSSGTTPKGEAYWVIERTLR